MGKIAIEVYRNYLERNPQLSTTGCREMIKEIEEAMNHGGYNGREICSKYLHEQINNSGVMQLVMEYEKLLNGKR